MRLWYFNPAVNIPTCFEHYMDGGLGKSLVKWLPSLIVKVWGKTNNTKICAYFDASFARLAQTRFPKLTHFHYGIFGIIFLFLSVLLLFIFL